MVTFASTSEMQMLHLLFRTHSHVQYAVRHKLQRHFIAVHENGRRFKCEVCSKKHEKKSSLKRHQLVSTAFIYSKNHDKLVLVWVRI